MARDSSTRNPRKSRKKPPISSHPAFPAIVALWFAALLGIGSLIVPVVLFEKLAMSTGLSAVFPSAQPPLGVTARVIIALGAVGIGILAGLLLARKVALAQSEPAPLRFNGTKVPISALEELGAPSLDQPVDEPPFGRSPDTDLDTDLMANIATASDDSNNPTKQRRASLVANESASDEFFEHVPTLGAADPTNDMAADPATGFAPDEEDAAPYLPAEAEPMNAQQLAERPLDQLGIVHLVERFALSLQTKTPAEVLNTDAALGSKADAPLADRQAQAMPEIPEALRPVEYDTATASYSDERANCSSLLDMKTALAAEPKDVRVDDTGDQGLASVHSFRPADADNNANDEVELRPRRFDPPQPIAAPERLKNDAEGAKTTSAGAELALREALEKLQRMSGVG